jgi:transaldolase
MASIRSAAASMSTEFRFLLNQDATATEKRAEGIRPFVKDRHALRVLVRNIHLRADAA